MNERCNPSPATWRVHPEDVHAEVWVAPSHEAMRLRRMFPGLDAADDDRWSGRLRDLVIAPYTQLTFVSFDLQMFLFDVLHLSPIARASHLVGFFGTNLAVTTLLSWHLGPSAGSAYVALLAAWYAAVASSVRLPGWALAMGPFLAAFAFGGHAFAAHLTSPIAAWGLLVASGTVSAFGHIAEPTMPPRTALPMSWVSVPDYVRGVEGACPRTASRVVRVLRVLWNVPLGILNELWAAPRLMPYTVLRAMMARGYATDLKAELDDRRDRAWASGNPALDYVGVGGGAVLRLEGSAPRSEAA